MKYRTWVCAASTSCTVEHQQGAAAQRRRRHGGGSSSAIDTPANGLKCCPDGWCYRSTAATAPWRE